MSILSKFNQALIERTEEASDYIAPYGVLGILGFICFYFLNSFFMENSVKEEIFLRSIAGIFCITLMLKDYWPKSTRWLLPIYWNTALIFNIPFFFTFMLLKKPDDVLWPIHWVLALTLLILLVDWISFLVISFLGIGIAIVVDYISDPHLNSPVSLAALVTAYITFAWYYIFLNISKNRQYKARITALQMQAGAIAHEMRTPLAAAGLIADGMALNLPILVHNQELAQEKDPSIPHIHPITLEGMAEIPSLLKSITRSAFTVIDMLLMNLKKDVPEEKPEKCSILTCVQTALQEYPLTQTDKGLVISEITQDFEFYGHPVLVKHVFFNLIKNALYYVKAAGKGKITIWTELGDRVNKVHVKDTGKGIPKDYLPHVFDQFFTRTDQGNGIGLAFCKMVMTKIGGDIICDSVEGEFTQFTLTFPTTRQFRQ
jgi:signal transduction histidine kinase